MEAILIQTTALLMLESKHRWAIPQDPGELFFILGHWGAIGDYYVYMPNKSAN